MINNFIQSYLSENYISKPIYNFNYKNVKPVIGIIFRFYNVKSKMTYLSYARDVKASIIELVLQLDNHQCKYSSLQKDWDNWDKTSKLFQVEELQSFYSENDLRSLINTWYYQLCGNDSNCLYNSDILDIYSFEEENYKLAMHLEQIIEQNKELKNSIDSLKQQLTKSQDIESIILDKIKNHPRTMFNTLTHWLTILNSNFDSSTNLNQVINQSTNISQSKDINKSKIITLNKVSKKHNQSKESIKKKTKLAISKIADVSDDGFKFYRGQDVDTWINEIKSKLQSSPLFMQELLNEIDTYKKAFNKKHNKGVQIFKMYCQRVSIDQIIKDLETNRNDIMHTVDSMQKRFPALYLASGLKRYTSKKKEKMVGKVLTKKGITDIPASF